MVKRDLFFDLLKCVAMFMVVVSHVLIFEPDLSACMHLANFLVGVNMPLFFVMSGYFARGMVRDAQWSKLRHRLTVYFWPMIIFGLFDVIMLLVQAKDISFFYSLSRIFLCMLRNWFFYVLAMCDVMAVFSSWLSKQLKINFYLVAFACWLGTLLVPLHVWHIGYVTTMFPFFLFGVCFLSRMMSFQARFKVAGVFCLVVYVGVSTLGGDFYQNGLSFYGHRFCVWRLDWWELFLTLTRYGLGLIGVIGIMGAMKLFYRENLITVFLSKLGSVTLGVYFVHFIIIHLLEVVSPRWDSVALVFVISAFIYGLSGSFVLWTRRNKWINFFLWGNRE